MPLHLSPIGNSQQVGATGAPLSGGKIYTYLAGSTTPAATYTDSTGGTPQANPIVLNSLGFVASPIWLTGGVSYKLVFTDADDVSIRTVDEVSGINDTVQVVSQWTASGFPPTYISASSFSVAGDKTADFHDGRRLQFQVTAGTVYGVVASSSFSGVTTVTVSMDSTALDAGLSDVNLAVLTATNRSVPVYTIPGNQGGVEPGAVIGFAGTTAPIGYLKCNGAAISRTTYAALYAALLTTWGSGDGSTTFNVPDFRGEFLRGFDDGKGTDSGRVFASSQTDQVKDHQHSGVVTSGNVNQMTVGSTTNVATLNTGNTGSMVSGASTETRPRNFPILYCIKY